jgi:hypothetical protein
MEPADLIIALVKAHVGREARDYCWSDIEMEAARIVAKLKPPASPATEPGKGRRYLVGYKMAVFRRAASPDADKDGTALPGPTGIAVDHIESMAYITFDHLNEGSLILTAANLKAQAEKETGLMVRSLLWTMIVPLEW